MSHNTGTWHGASNSRMWGQVPSATSSSTSVIPTAALTVDLALEAKSVLALNPAASNTPSICRDKTIATPPLDVRSSKRKGATGYRRRVMPRRQRSASFSEGVELLVFALLQPSAGLISQRLSMRCRHASTGMWSDSDAF